MTYAYTPDPLADPAASVVLPDGGDTGAAGATAASSALEGIADMASFAAYRVGRVYSVGLETGGGVGGIGQSNSATYGTGDYLVFGPGVIDVATTDSVTVDIHFHGYSASNTAEFELGYKIGSGSIVDLLYSKVWFDSLTANRVPISTSVTFTPATAGDLSIYIRVRSPAGVNTVTTDGPYHATVRVAKVIDT